MIDVRAIRRSLNLTQDQFALRFEINVATLRQWEQHRHEPPLHAKALLAIIAHSPEIVDQALKLAL